MTIHWRRPTGGSGARVRRRATNRESSNVLGWASSQTAASTASPLVHVRGGVSWHTVNGTTSTAPRWWVSATPVSGNE